MADVNQLIADFYRVASVRDFQRDVQFRVLAVSPFGTTTTYNEDDLVYARAAKLPARAITNVPAKYMGLTFNVLGTTTYPESETYTLEFYNDINNNLHKKFENWSRDIFDDADSTGNYQPPPQASTIDLIQLDTNMVKICQYKLVGVGIRDVGPIEYKMADGSGQYVTFPVTLSYHYFTRSDD